VKVIERQKDWVKVEDFEGEQGWIAAKLLAKDHTVIVSAEHANLRKEPSLHAELAGTAERTEVYRVVERRGHWLKLSADDEERGWIRDDLVWGD
jgi:SH3-like domain-containing protein